MQPWTIKQLQEALLQDLQACSNDFERGMAMAIGGREIREKAIEFAAMRKLTPVEVAIAQSYGYGG